MSLSRLRSALPQLLALALVLGINAIVFPSFFDLAVRNDRLYGPLIDVLNRGAPVMLLAIGMTLVIATKGVDLSVGAIAALCSVWATTFATQTMAGDTHWLLMVFVALAVGSACGLVNGVLIAYGKVVPFITTLAMLAAARGLAEIISERRTQIVTDARHQQGAIVGQLFYARRHLIKGTRHRTHFRRTIFA